MNDPSNTPSHVPERGNCFVCGPISDTILLIQATAFLPIIIIPFIFMSPLAKIRDKEWAQSEKIRSRYTGFCVLWTLCLIIHATIKWFADSWATYNPLKGSEDDDFGSKHMWVRIATNCFSIVVLVGFFTAMAAGDWLNAKILGKFGKRRMH